MRSSRIGGARDRRNGAAPLASALWTTPTRSHCQGGARGNAVGSWCASPRLPRSRWPHRSHSPAPCRTWEGVFSWDRALGSHHRRSRVIVYFASELAVLAASCVKNFQILLIFVKHVSGTGPAGTMSGCRSSISNMVPVPARLKPVTDKAGRHIRTCAAAVASSKSLLAFSRSDTKRFASKHA
eukprot:scaffold2069_cov254-Pinguiococcus_pyrenoidosus.AAC.20